MYSQSDITSNKNQFKLRLIYMGIALLITIAASTVLLIMRLEYPLMLAGAAGLCATYYIWITKAYPFYSYGRFLRDISEGLSRETVAHFISLTPETTMRDNVAVHVMMVRVGEAEEDERLFYFDHDKPLPAFEPGQTLTITSFGNYVTGIA